MNHCLIFNIKQQSPYLAARSAGGHRIASHLRNQSWNAEVIDFVGYWTLEELKRLAKTRINSHTKFIGFSYLFNKVKNPIIDAFCAYIKTNFPNIILISGGQGYPQHGNTLIDYHIIGYGEHALDALLKYEFSNGTRPKFEITKYNNTKIINAIHNHVSHPYKEPIIRYESRDFIQPNEWLFVEFSRGCKFACKFCNFPVLGVREDYTRTAESFYDELNYNYENYGVTSYTVTDETFNDSLEKMTKFANVVQTLDFTPSFTGFVRGDLLIHKKPEREEFLRMNFLGHFYGIETFNHESGKSIGKGMNPDKMKNGLIELKEYYAKHAPNRYWGTCSFIAGLPYETLESLDETRSWLLKHWHDQSVALFALELSDQDFRPSDFSTNYAKLGYEKIDSKIYSEHTYYLSQGDFQSKEDNSIFLWRNKHMDIFQADNWVRELWQHFPIENNFYGAANIYPNDDLSLLTNEQKHHIPREKAFTNHNNFIKFVERYKQQKLSL